MRPPQYPPSFDVMMPAVAFGAGAVVERSAELFTIVKLAGAAYLVCLGVQAVWHRRSMAGALAARATPAGPWRAARDGFLVGVANPKTIVFLTITLPSFTGHGGIGGPGDDRPRRQHRGRRPQGLTGGPPQGPAAGERNRQPAQPPTGATGSR
jgi:hypothetical protein